MDEILKRIAATFERIQNLELQPTQHNVDILHDSLEDLKAAYMALTAAQEQSKPKQEEEDAAENRES